VVESTKYHAIYMQMLYNNLYLIGSRAPSTAAAHMYMSFARRGINLYL